MPFWKHHRHLPWQFVKYQYLIVCMLRRIASPRFPRHHVSKEPKRLCLCSLHRRLRRKGRFGVSMIAFPGDGPPPPGLPRSLDPSGFPRPMGGGRLASGDGWRADAGVYGRPWCRRRGAMTPRLCRCRHVRPGPRAGPRDRRASTRRPGNRFRTGLPGVFEPFRY
jgi:hypothetical protein